MLPGQKIACGVMTLNHQLPEDEPRTRRFQPTCPPRPIQHDARDIAQLQRPRSGRKGPRPRKAGPLGRGLSPLIH
jgi:hypothetical protein